MLDLAWGNNAINAQLLLNGFWYSDLPDLLNMSELEESIEVIFEEINSGKIAAFKQDTDKFIEDFSGITSPPYIRSPGVEAISFFDFKKNKSLREMQIPHLLHYFAFMYNTLLNFEPIFEKLYITPDNSRFIANSNSYLVFGDEFVLRSYDDDETPASDGVFITKNNKINSSAALAENKRRLLATEADYLYSLKMDIESFFPNLYTHNFEKIAYKKPFSTLHVDPRYFIFLDQFHQRINNNQTKGIPAGTFSSHVAAELCMLCVDEEIRLFLEKRENPVGYVRYVDDLSFFSDSESELAELYPVIQSILNKYRLRINGNKTESTHAVYITQQTYLAELEHEFPKLKLAENSKDVEITLDDFFVFKRYVGKCICDGRSSQLKALLTVLLRRLQEGRLNINNVSAEMFYLLIKLVFEDVTLASQVYRLLDHILEHTPDSEALMDSLRKKQGRINAEYPDTVFQIWQYYVLFRHSDEDNRSAMIKSLKDKTFNPLVAAAMVLPGKGKNRELYKLIRDLYIKESDSKQWQNEIMYSKWWLPLFKISRYDSHDYDHFMKSSNFPALLKSFTEHTENDSQLVVSMPVSDIMEQEEQCEEMLEEWFLSEFA